MLRLFIRLYVFLMLPAIAAFVLFMYVTDQVMDQMHLEQSRARWAGAFERAERIINDTRVPDWQGRLKLIEETFRIEHTIVPMSQAQSDWFMSAGEKERLRDGQVALRDRPGGGSVSMRRLKDTDRVLKIESVGAFEYVVWYYVTIIALVSLAMCFILYRWAKPIWRDVEALKAATARVGEGDFHVRATVGRGSLVEPIATAFNAMAGRVQALLRSHSDLEQSVAHELRTPLAQLKFDLELARTSHTPEDRERRYLAMEQDVIDLEELVNELLLLASLREAPPYQPREIAARTLMDEVIRRAKDEMRATRRDIAIEAPKNLPENISCDTKYLSRALVNVVRNAARYANTRVALTVETAGERTVINVDDDGPGIPPGERERLFEPFTRLEGARDRETGGVGLGLAIVKSVAEWHGGSARISDSPLGGARVSITW
ncbi:Sensor protein RstB [Usitatibacter rugosus]|uniref:histidine kinase n=1 Tax=Usitatibacter rugosus TaxID=2732067 RepID=A0A6M4GPF6_9PROT|nr:ATP-binding protein [Usitatibacter rugosus]QJR09210.1 Sensor protein RstB [Usitatibacter rugosus]